jgi:hypothetical protein
LRRNSNRLPQVCEAFFGVSLSEERGGETLQCRDVARIRAQARFENLRGPGVLAGCMQLRSTSQPLESVAVRLLSQELSEHRADHAASRALIKA